MFTYNIRGDNIIILQSLENPATVLVFRIDTSNGKLSKLQNIFLKQNNVEHYVIDGELYLIACTTQTFCAVYKWTNLQFRRHRKLNANVFENVKSIYSYNDLVFVEDKSKNLQFYAREEDVASSKSGLTIPKNFNEFLVYHSTFSERLYFVDANFTDKQLVINYREIVRGDNNFESRDADAAEINPISFVTELKEQLKARIMDVGKTKTMVS